jgi:outer membrane protein
MFRTRIGAVAFALGVAALGAGAPARAQGGPGRVGVVSIERLYADSKAAKAADARIGAEFSGRKKANLEMLARLKTLSEQFDADAPNLAEAERLRRRREVLDLDKEVQRKEAAFHDDLVQRKSEEQAQFAEKAHALIVRVAQQEKIDIVLFRDVLWTRPDNDITDKIIKQLDL